MATIAALFSCNVETIALSLNIKTFCLIEMPYPDLEVCLGITINVGDIVAYGSEL